MNKITPEDVVREFEIESMHAHANSLGTEHMCEWLRSTLTTLVEAAREEGRKEERKRIREAVNGLASTSHSDNPEHSRDEIYCCIECYEDIQKQKAYSKVLSLLTSTASLPDSEERPTSPITDK